MSNPAIKKCLDRDFPGGKAPICLFCRQLFNGQMQIDHLDNDRGNNAMWNYAIVHPVCNQRKKENAEYQHLAEKKIIWNKAVFFDEKRALESENEHINSNMVLIRSASRYLEDNLPTTLEKVEYSDSVDCITYLQMKEIGHSSQASTIRALKTLTCSIADYKILDTENGKYIVRRVK